MAEWKCIIIIGWKVFAVMHFTYRSQSTTSSSNNNNSQCEPEHIASNFVHLISCNKSDLLLVKTFYLHIHRRVFLLSALLLLTSSRKLILVMRWGSIPLTHWFSLSLSCSLYLESMYVSQFVSRMYKTEWLIWFCMKIPHKRSRLDSF